MNGIAVFAGVAAHCPWQPWCSEIHFHQEDKSLDSLELISGSIPEWSELVKVGSSEGITSGKERQPHRSQLEEVNHVTQQTSHVLPMCFFHGE